MRRIKKNFLFEIFGISIFIILFGVVSAGTIEVNIETLKDHTLNVNFLNPDRNSGEGPISYGSITKDTGTGELSFTFSSTASSFDIDVFLMKGKEVLAHELFEGVKNNQKVLIVLVPGVVREITEDYNPSAQSSQSSSSSTSNSILELSNQSNPISENASLNQENQDSQHSQQTSELNQEIQSANQEHQVTKNSFFNNNVFPFILGSLIILIILLGLAFIYKILFKKLKKQLEKDMKKNVVLKDPLVSLENKLREALKDVGYLKKERAKNKNIQRGLRKDIEEKKRIIKQIKFTKKKLAEDKQRLNSLRSKLRNGKEKDN